MRPRFVPLLVACALLASACGGPPSPLEGGVKEYPTDILLGAGGEAVEAPRTPPPPDVGSPLLVRPRAPRRTPPPAGRPPGQDVRPDPCPEAGPLAHPRLQAPTEPAAGPPEATYPYRNDGAYEIVAAETEKGTYDDSERAIEIIDESETGFEYESTDSLGITIRYRIVHSGSADPLNVALEPGAYITEIRSEIEGGTGTFEPVNPVLVVQFPISEGNEHDATGASPSGDTVLRFHSRVGKPTDDPDDPLEARARIDACGTMLQGWWIELTNGSVQGPGKDLSFTALYAFAPQYGMLPISEEIEITGTDGGADVSSTRRSVISKEPREPS